MTEPTRDGDRRRAMTRRAYLAVTATLPALAGCTGGDSPEDGGGSGGGAPGPDGGTTADPEGEPTAEPTTAASDGSPPAEGTAHLFEEDIPADPAFIANPDVSGPGGDAELLVPLGISSRGEQDEFEAFVVRIEEVVLETDGGETVAVPIDVELDALAYEHGGTVRGDTITVGWLLAIPTAHYTAVEYELSPVEVVHESDGDVAGQLDSVGSRPLGNDGEGTEVEADVLFRPMPDFRVTYEPWDDRFVFGPESDTVGFHTMPRNYFDPSEYGE